MYYSYISYITPAKDLLIFPVANEGIFSGWAQSKLMKWMRTLTGSEVQQWEWIKRDSSHQFSLQRVSLRQEAECFPLLCILSRKRKFCVASWVCSHAAACSPEPLRAPEERSCEPWWTSTRRLCAIWSHSTYQVRGRRLCVLLWREKVDLWSIMCCVFGKYNTVKVIFRQSYKSESVCFNTFCAEDDIL